MVDGIVLTAILIFSTRLGRKSAIDLLTDATRYSKSEREVFQVLEHLLRGLPGVTFLSLTFLTFPILMNPIMTKHYI